MALGARWFTPSLRPVSPRMSLLQAEGPKTIEEIHREEALKRSRSAMLDRQQSGRGDSFRGPRGGPPPGCVSAVTFPALWQCCMLSSTVR